MHILPIARPIPTPSNDESLKDALVGFFSHSKASSRLLRLLATKREPIRYNALMHQIRFGDALPLHDHELPASAVRAVLWTTQLAGLVTLTRDGFSITALGREVQRR